MKRQIVVVDRLPNSSPRRPHLTLLAALLACAAFTAFTASTVWAAGEVKRRVLVSDAVANGVDKGLAATLTSMLVARLGAQPNVEAFSGAELKRLMALEADKAACGSDETCVAELTDALGAPLAVFSDVGKLGTLTVVNLTLFDVQNAVPLARAPVEAAKLEELPAKLDKAVADLLAKAPPPSTSSSNKKLEVIAPEGARSGDALSASGSAGGRGLKGGGGGGGGSGIGLGSIGTVGHGSGSGQSYRSGAGGAKKEKGVAAPAAAPPTGAADARPEVHGGVDREAVRSTVASHRGEIKACYERALEKNPKLTGTISVRFFIAADGSVAWANVARTDIVKSPLPKCLIEKVSTWKFPLQGPVTVAYPFVFKPE